MPKMRAKKIRAYAGKNLKGGEVFNAQDKDVRLLEVSGLAEKYKEERKPEVKVVKVKTEAPYQPQQYITRDLTPEPEPEFKSHYKRRDLTAE